MNHKYRAWVPDRNEMIYGCLIQRKRDGYDVYYIYDSSWDETEIDEYETGCNSKTSLKACFEEVDIKNVMRCIGLMDRDGIAIFEKDILSTRDREELYTVYWSKAGCSFVMNSIDEHGPIQRKISGFLEKVVGNSIVNPEMVVSERPKE